MLFNADSPDNGNENDFNPSTVKVGMGFDFDEVLDNMTLPKTQQGDTWVFEKCAKEFEFLSRIIEKKPLRIQIPKSRY